jgi:hypothetical protein
MNTFSDLLRDFAIDTIEMVENTHKDEQEDLLEGLIDIYIKRFIKEAQKSIKKDLCSIGRYFK